MGKTDSTRLEALDALLAEKRKHEGYLAKLEGRRASTPDQVYARLRDEYLTKLTDLQVRASSEAESLTTGLQEDEVAVAEIEERLAAATEERVEGELRAEVGEYEPKEWSKKLEQLTATINKIEREREARSSVLERTRALLSEATGGVVAAAPAAPEKPAPPRAAAEKPIKEPPSAPKPTPSTPAKAATTEAPKEEEKKPAPATPSKGAPLATGPSFDELAFLNSVVGRVSTPVRVDPPTPVPRGTRTASEIKETPSAPAPAAAAAAAATAAPAEPATAAPTPRPSVRTSKAQSAADEPPPVLGRPTPRTSQAIKTLKCQECGALNYPTEWYCERCGGELAAM